MGSTSKRQDKLEERISAVKYIVFLAQLHGNYTQGGIKTKGVKAAKL
jgi:hypothetical protein